jgi:hypothetical protein
MFEEFLMKNNFFLGGGEFGFWVFDFWVDWGFGFLGKEDFFFGEKEV